MNRRQLLTSAAAMAGAGLADQVLAPVKALAADAKPIRIKAIEAFNIEMPATETEIEAGVMYRAGVTRVVTESGVKGYSFTAAAGGGRGGGAAAGGARGGRGGGLGPNPAAFPKMQQTLIGADLFAVEQHLQKGLNDFPTVEEAIWDAIGKVAGQPVYRLLGGSKTTMPVYITAVWRGNPDQSQVPIKDQAVYARCLKDAGFNGFKMRIFRPNFMDDVDSCAGIIAACGPAPGF